MQNEKKTTRCVGERLSEQRETFGGYNSLLVSDLMNHKAIWSNYMRIAVYLKTDGTMTGQDRASIPQLAAILSP